MPHPTPLQLTVRAASATFLRISSTLQTTPHMSGSLASALFWIAVACCLIAQIAITAAAAREPHPIETEGDVPLPHRTTEIAWSLVPAVMLAAVLLLTWNVMRVADTRDGPAPAALAEPRSS